MSTWRLVLLLLAFSPVARGSSSPGARSVAELVDLSDRVVLGRVIEMRPVDSVPPRTAVTFEIEERLKGAPGATVELQLLGRREPGWQLFVAGEPTFRVGERSLLFLRCLPSLAPACSLAAPAQGVLRVEGERVEVPVPLEGAYGPALTDWLTGLREVAARRLRAHRRSSQQPAAVLVPGAGPTDAKAGSRVQPPRSP